MDLQRTHHMRVVINFTLRRDAWFVYASTEEEGSPISPVLGIGDKTTLIHLLRYLGATKENIDEVLRNIQTASQGDVWIDLMPGRRNLLRIQPPWSGQLRLA